MIKKAKLINVKKVNKNAFYIVYGTDSSAIKNFINLFNLSFKEAEYYSFDIKTINDADNCISELGLVNFFISKKVVHLAVDGFTKQIEKSLYKIISTIDKDISILLEIRKSVKSFSSFLNSKELANFNSEIFYLSAYTLDTRDLVKYIEDFLRENKFKFIPQIPIDIALSYENNMESLDKYFEIFLLVFSSEYELKRADVLESLNIASSYTVFNLIDSIFGKAFKRSIRILESLSTSKNSPSAILRIIQKEFVFLLKLANASNMHLGEFSRSSLKAVFDEAKVFEFKRGIYVNFLSYISYEKLLELLQYLWVIEQSIKSSQDNPWKLLEKFILKIIVK
ncbi:MAG: DNA polymerase III subunit delta [Psittacicella sp.]